LGDAYLRMSQLDLIVAQLDHRECVWRINNHPRVRSASFSESTIPWEDHVRWFGNILEDPDRLLLVGLQNDAVVSVVRFDKIDRDDAEISVAVDPESQGRGLGKLTIMRGSQQCFQYWPDVSSVLARIREENSASLRAFEAAGYKYDSESYTDGGKTISLRLVP